ncbi:scavenger receptor cysteine-rich domain protein [Ancylostoma caninum]|uniref:Scavenger receptor cysteine-rich domain protein n=1 Tax=Ancylostoma caninum TaxID=29170 RepID=A0A368GHI0_ANCCA|nr:scavenger receptor cysteine-rich domain protein [Ancylostoma caninum]
MKQLSFRLVDGNEISGSLQVSFKGMWQPVCAQNIGQDPADTICRNMNMGTPANVLAARVLNSFGWQLNCDGRCSVRGFTFCQYGARIRCHSNKPNVSGSCGLRRVSGVARDPIVVRYARVVGGFETAAGAFPWTAAVKAKATGAHHCGASVLDRTHLITAAHCFE